MRKFLKLPSVAKPKASRTRTARPLLIATVISFSLTFVGVSVALLLGLLPAEAASLTGVVDTGVVLLLVPLCALVFAIMFEVLRAAMRGPLRSNSPHPGPALSGWRPGHGEG